MKAGSAPSPNLPEPKPPVSPRLWRWFFAALLLLLTMQVQGAPVVGIGTPISFFTNIAQRLLQSQMGMDLYRIQIYPTNQYTPAVHRLLQVSANLYDAATNRAVPGDTSGLGYPSVFRPLFTNVADTIYISGYAEVTDANALLIQRMRDVSDPGDRAQLQAWDMVYGIPVVIGAKKGWPNFNEFSMQTQIEVTRYLQFLRDPVTTNIIATNQMYVASIANIFGVEAWNSYRTDFPRSLKMIAIADCRSVMTNEVGVVLVTNRCGVVMVTNIGGGTWPGFLSAAYPNGSFQLPLFTNYWALTNSEFRFGSDPTEQRFVPLSGVFEDPHPSKFPVPHWWLTQNTRFRFALIDTNITPNRIVDYVNLDSARDLRKMAIDMTSTLTSDGPCGAVYQPSGGDSAEWCTNRLGQDDGSPTFGIRNQINVCLGVIYPPTGHWKLRLQVDGGPFANVDFFRAQFGLSPIFSYSTFSLSNEFYAPFNAFRDIYYYTAWQANDPLVHYAIGDLTDGVRTNRLELDSPYSSSLTNLGALNTRYEPWGVAVNPARSTSKTKLDLSVKDPLVTCSDDWNFPTNFNPGFDWIGRVHRGTPWQTISLKSATNDFNTWVMWTGDTLLSTNRINGKPVATADAAYTLPNTDRRLASLVVSLLNTNDPGSLFSVNQPDIAGWRRVLDGMTVLTNVSSTQLVPVVMTSNSPQAVAIATALDAAGAARPGHYFRDLGDLLSTPQLTLASPWLNRSSIATNSLTDEAYEMIPSQLLPLLRPDSVGSVAATAVPPQVQFTGFDDWRYAVQVSSNLVEWTAISTNSPSNGVFNVSGPAAPGGQSRFYRSVLAP